MSLTSGVISLVSVSSSQVQLVCTAASGGTGPYTYQWYRSTASGFTPGGGNILAGKTALSLTDIPTPGTVFYYKVVSTDTGNSNITVEATQLAVTVPVPSQNPNQFDQTVTLGMLDLAFNPDTVAVQIDSSQATALVAGSFVKIVDSAGGVPKVIGCTADADEAMGVIVYNIKNAAYLPGMAAQVAMADNVVYLMATAAIARGVRVAMENDTIGGVKPLAASGGADIVGWAYDKASAAGQMIRVKLLTPSYAKDV